MKPKIVDEDDIWLNSAEVRLLFGNVSHMSLYRWTHGKNFPRPVKFSGRNYWSRRSVLAFRAEVQTTRLTKE
jgi:predicted DNA-binding transcriptional regulator AlpA